MGGHSNWKAFSKGSPTQVSDIPITQCWQVECPDHGIVDEPKTFAAAVQARRDHFARFHSAADHND